MEGWILGQLIRWKEEREGDWKSHQGSLKQSSCESGGRWPPTTNVVQERLLIVPWQNGILILEAKSWSKRWEAMCRWPGLCTLNLYWQKQRTRERFIFPNIIVVESFPWDHTKLRAFDWWFILPFTKPKTVEVETLLRYFKSWMRRYYV